MRGINQSSRAPTHLANTPLASPWRKAGRLASPIITFVVLANGVLPIGPAWGIADGSAVHSASVLGAMNAYPMTMVAATLALQDILARLRGRAALYPGAILFVIAALLATATNSLVSLTFTRALQGLGGAALLCGLPSDTSTSSNDPPSGRNAAMTATLAAVSSCALPSLAGVVASAALYHWFFALSALLVIAGVFASDSSSLTIRRSAGAKAALRASALGSLTLSSISLGLWEYANHASDYLLRAFIGTALLFGVIWLKEWLYDTAPLDFSEFRPRRDRCMESSFRPPFTAPKSWLCSP